MQRIIIFLIIIVLANANMFAQSSWKRKAQLESTPVQLFQSTDVFDLPTSETLQKGDIFFSISHKFTTAVSEGLNELFGFDGSVIMRIALGYAISDDLLIKLGRTNHQGNYELAFKYNFLNLRDDNIPLKFTFNGGIAYNSKSIPEPVKSSKLYQYFGSIIVNTMIEKKLGIGIIPSVLFNSNIYYPENINSTVLGAYLQYYFNSNWSVFVEAYPTLNGWRKKYDGYNIGVDLNTGGHFFKIVLGNNIYTNLNGILTGAPDKFESGNLHIGFMIIRIL